MDNKKLYFLAKTADILIKELDSFDLVKELKDILTTYIELKSLNVYVFDPNTSTLRNYAQNWCVIDEVMQDEVKAPIYQAYNDIHGYDFVLNNKAYKLPQLISEITLKIGSLYMPIVKNGMVFGVIGIEFLENTSVDMEFLFLMKIFGAQISLKLQNIVLNEQSQINVEFHDSMKNIAKLIETQYEINYIVPLIGEMLDRFISDHLIYVFLKQEEEFRLVWPKACNDERVFEILKQLDKDYPSMIAYDDKIGAFPLISEDEITRGAEVQAEEIIQQARQTANEIVEQARASATELTEQARAWSKEMRTSASEYVESIVAVADETLTNSVNEIRRARQHLRAASQAKRVDE